MIQKLWQKLASVHLTYKILLVCSIIMSIGAYYMKVAPGNMSLLNYYSVVSWLKRYGAGPIHLTWWLWVLFFVLFLLGVNTAACILERLRLLLKKHRQMTRGHFFYQLTPTLIHGVFFILLCCHFVGNFFAWQTVESIQPGKEFTLSGTDRLSILDIRNEFYAQPQILKGYPLQSTVKVRLAGKDTQLEKTVQYLRPVFWNGYSIHLDMINPKYAVLPHPCEPGTKQMVIIKRDPGVFLIMAGFVVIIGLLFWYYTGRKKWATG